MALLGIISCCMGFPLLVESRGSSLVAELGFFITVASLAEHGLEVHGLQQLQFSGSRAQAQQLWYVDDHNAPDALETKISSLPSYSSPII